MRKTFSDLFYNQNNYTKLNKPRRKAYISVSKKIPNELYELEKSDLAKMVNSEITYINSKINEFKTRINMLSN